MRFGVFLPYIRPELSKPLRQVYRDAAEQIECADAAGFDVIWFPEHHFTHNYCAPAPLVSVVDAARRTRRARVGTSVIVTPFYHPLILAEQVALVDHLVEGRLEVGFARGSSRYEYVRLGLTDAEAADRQREALDVLLGVWQADEDFEYQGRYYSFPPAYVVPRPLQEPHPPIWVAARTPDTLRYCVEHGLGVHTTTLRQAMTATHATLRTIDALVEELGAAARPPFAIQRETFVSESWAEVMAAMELVRRNHVRGFNQSRATTPSIRGYGSLDPLPEGMQLTVEDIAERSIVGDPETCVRKLREYEATGACEFIANMDFGEPQAQVLRSLELFGSRVIPHFREPAAAPTDARPRDPAEQAASAERRRQLVAWGERELGAGWRQWDTAAWLEHFDRLGPGSDRPGHYVFDLGVAPQNARADAGGVMEPTGRLMMIRDQQCPKCARPVIALYRRWHAESPARMRADIARRLDELDWHALHP
jgi:alkanesulfonate monooxygenase SsuD/methylene tetrahydromethanopterin reductase-like flavin-dependent oxidoreductase (luciferase family)